MKRVTSNVGAKTAGVDGITWRTLESKIQAVNSLSRKAYKPFPLRRIYIPKKSGKLWRSNVSMILDQGIYQNLQLLMQQGVTLKNNLNSTVDKQPISPLLAL